MTAGCGPKAVQLLVAAGRSLFNWIHFDPNPVPPFVKSSNYTIFVHRPSVHRRRIRSKLKGGYVLVDAAVICSHR